MDFQEKVFWLKNRYLRNDAFVAFQEAMRYDELPAEQKIAIEFEKQKAIVSYAYQHVPYYRELYQKHHFDPHCLKSPSDWDLVPILEKDILRYHPDSVLSEEYQISDLTIATTSGSTGTPLKVYKDPKIHVEVMGWRGLKWWGISPAANMAKLHRNAASSITNKLKNRLLWWPTKRAYLNASLKLTDQELERFVEDLNSMKIIWMQGYCSIIESVADYILRSKHDVSLLQTVWCTSAPLKKSVREKMEKAFHCKIMDQYGCNELWNIAIQKKDEPYLTVSSDFVHVDTITNEGKQTKTNEKGEILITDLNCKAFPLIKYRLGDKGSFAKMPSESEDGYPKLNFVDGRTSDNIILKDGKIIDGVYLTAICDDYPDFIDAYQIYQSKDYTITVKLVLKEQNEANMKVANMILQSVVKTVGDPSLCKMELLNHIADTNGKKRYIISEVKI